MFYKELYLIKSEIGYYKIGIATSTESRLTNLQTGSSHKLHVVHSLRYPAKYVRKIELGLHNQFAMSRIQHNREWFNLSCSIERDFKYHADAIYNALVALDSTNVCFDTF